MNEEEKVPQHGDLQTLQLIFRGVLTPTLEHADVVTFNGNSYILPDGFIHFITEKQEESKSGGGRKDRIEGGESNSGNDWLDTTFDHLMDGCISLCLKSMKTYQTDLLIEEVLAMFNNCLISDSGALAIRGIKKLYHFITNDLEVESITDDTWATLCHLLNKCLRIRGIPSSNKDSDELSEFVLQEEILADRRYIFPHATHMIGSLLTNKTIVKSMGMRWYLFLVSGLGEGIQEWERAAAIMDMFPPRNLVSTASGSTPPHYFENALYARKWIVKFLLVLMTKSDALCGHSATKDSNTEDGLPPLRKKSVVIAKKMINEESALLLKAFLTKDTAVTSSGLDKTRQSEMEHMTKIICDLLEQMNKLGEDSLKSLSGLTPTLSSCIQVNNTRVRDIVTFLVNRMFEGPLSDRLANEPKKEQPTVIKQDN